MNDLNYVLQACSLQGPRSAFKTPKEKKKKNFTSLLNPLWEQNKASKTKWVFFSVKWMMKQKTRFELDHLERPADSIKGLGASQEEYVGALLNSDY